MKVVVLGGTGFIGSKICETLIEAGHTVTSVSRHGQPASINEAWFEEVHWLASDILTDKLWQKDTKEADWVIDTIGILFEKKQHNVTYDRFVTKPVSLLLAYLEKENPEAKFLFISANTAPFILKRYLNAKKEAEGLIKESPITAVIFYPSMVTGKGRFFETISGIGIRFVKKIPLVAPLVRGYDPMTREQLAKEITQVVAGGTSRYTRRQLT